MDPTPGSSGSPRTVVGAGWRSRTLETMEDTLKEEEEEEEFRKENGRMVAGQYELVRTIFTYLPWRDLETCAKVKTKI